MFAQDVICTIVDLAQFICWLNWRLLNFIKFNEKNFSDVWSICYLKLHKLTLFTNNIFNYLLSPSIDEVLYSKMLIINKYIR